MYGFAAAVSTSMLAFIGLAVAFMATMTASALYFRASLGGKHELRVFNLGKAADTADLAQKTKESGWVRLGPVGSGWVRLGPG